MGFTTPLNPVPIDESAQISGGAQDVVYSIRRAGESLWLVDGLPGLQSEVRDVGSGRYQVLHTNGAAPTVGLRQ